MERSSSTASSRAGGPSRPPPNLRQFLKDRAHLTNSTVLENTMEVLRDEEVFDLSDLRVLKRTGSLERLFKSVTAAKIADALEDAADQHALPDAAATASPSRSLRSVVQEAARMAALSAELQRTQQRMQQAMSSPPSASRTRPVEHTTPTGPTEEDREASPARSSSGVMEVFHSFSARRQVHFA